MPEDNVRDVRKNGRFTIRAERAGSGTVFRALLPYPGKSAAIVCGQVYVQEHSRGYGYVHDMYVDPTQRREGCGRALMDAVIRQYGTGRLELVCQAGSCLTVQQLGKFYTAFGFAFGPSAWTTRPPKASDARRMYRPGQPPALPDQETRS